MRRYPNADLTGLLPINTDGDMWDVGTVFYSMDEVGKAEFLSGKGFDMPYASSLMDQKSRGYHLAGIGYEWSTQELQRAAKLGRALGSDKAAAARKSAQFFKRGVAMTGRAPGTTASEKGWTGFINDANVPTANVAADGTGSATTWATKTPDQISRDIWAAVNAVEAQTGKPTPQQRLACRPRSCAISSRPACRTLARPSWPTFAATGMEATPSTSSPSANWPVLAHRAPTAWWPMTPRKRSFSSTCRAITSSFPRSRSRR